MAQGLADGVDGNAYFVGEGSPGVTGPVGGEFWENDFAFLG